MADFSVAVEYDRLYPIKIKHGGEETGITVFVVSKDAKRVVDATRKAQQDYWSELASGNKDAPSPDIERVILVNCIDSWDWGENTWSHIGGSGVATLEDREFLIDHPNSKWFRDQIADGTANLENFSQPSQRNARRGSKKT